MGIVSGPRSAVRIPSLRVSAGVGVRSRDRRCE
jgi:hypothetical protein